MKDNPGTEVRLFGDNFILRPWELADAAWYVASRDEEVFKWTTEVPELTVSSAEKAIVSVNNDPMIHSFAIAAKNSNELLGNLCLVLRGKYADCGELMYWLAPVGRGRGIATKSLILLCEWAFASHKLKSICLKTKAGNIRSQSVAVRAGFQPMSEQDIINKEPGWAWFELAGAHENI